MKCVLPLQSLGGTLALSLVHFLPELCLESLGKHPTISNGDGNVCRSAGAHPIDVSAHVLTQAPNPKCNVRYDWVADDVATQRIYYCNGDAKTIAGVSAARWRRGPSRGARSVEGFVRSAVISSAPCYSSQYSVCVRSHARHRPA
jgi:hypothetical protein